MLLKVTPSHVFIRFLSIIDWNCLDLGDCILFMILTENTSLGFWDGILSPILLISFLFITSCFNVTMQSISAIGKLYYVKNLGSKLNASGIFILYISHGYKLWISRTYKYLRLMFYAFYILLITIVIVSYFSLLTPFYTNFVSVWWISYLSSW